MNLVPIARRLRAELDGLAFGAPVEHVYNPLDYARAPAEQYLERYARPDIEALWLGMNPGPYGMVQTGVPFGEVAAVRDWLGIAAAVRRPRDEHPSRPIEGFACRRSEVSGRRLWGFAAQRFGTPERFFARFFVWNYCPLAFLEAGGRNRTPDKLPAAERAALYEPCDRALGAVIDALRPRLLVGVGGFATQRLAPFAAARGLRVGTLLHPSPASPRANRGWERQAEADLCELGITMPAAS
jgi:single-strand selective monofunctional uracil DNA glycosylase